VRRAPLKPCTKTFGGVCAQRGKKRRLNDDEVHHQPAKLARAGEDTDVVSQ